MAKLTWLVVALLSTLAFSDLYMSCPRGSNNRLNEQAANRNNGDRLYDSQNNNRGGYNVGDRNNAAFNGNSPTLATPEAIYDFTTLGTAAQYPMVYFEGSKLPIEWANQHGCGGNLINDPNKLNCEIVMQYTCDTTRNGADQSTAYAYAGVGDYALGVYLYDGGNTNTPDEPNTANDVSSGATKASNDNNQRGRHESEGWYYECKTRSRNRRLFTADQNLNGNTAIYTRQNPNGNRRGLECPEERDYYPYWAPNPWRDIAYLTDRLDHTTMIETNSMNYNQKFKCKQPGGGYTNTAIIQALNQADCTTAGGNWIGFSHDLPAADPRTKVVVEQMPWTRDNHLGNGRDGVAVNYNWTLPLFSSFVASGHIRTFGASNNYVKCIFRLRYNMSTDDYDPWNTTSTSNNNPGAGIKSPVTQNPTVDVGAQDLQGLALAINTNQFGRTFQDRSHVFYIKQRPATLATTGTMWNLNVRGKRGNIVQTYPAVEYDFMPNILEVSAAADMIHMQWTGSNTHNNGDPAGDGQAGDAGEGTTGTDRNNWVQSMNSDDNYPVPLDVYQDVHLLLKGNSQCYNHNGMATSDTSTALYGPAAEVIPGFNCALILATSGQYIKQSQASSNFNPTLNDAPASLIGGIIIKPSRQGTYNYINTRNNNFSNRAQKGAITVSP